MTPQVLQHQHLAEILAIEQAANAFPWSLKNFEDSLRANHQAWVFLDKDLNVVARRTGNLPQDQVGQLLVALANQ